MPDQSTLLQSTEGKSFTPLVRVLSALFSAGEKRGLFIVMSFLERRVLAALTTGVLLSWMRVCLP